MIVDTEDPPRHTSPMDGTGGPRKVRRDSEHLVFFWLRDVLELYKHTAEHGEHRVRTRVYWLLAERGRPPTVSRLAARLGRQKDELT